MSSIYETSKLMEIYNQGLFVFYSSKQSLRLKFKRDCGLIGPNTQSKVVGTLAGPLGMLNLLQIGFSHCESWIIIEF